MVFILKTYGYNQWLLKIKNLRIGIGIGIGIDKDIARAHVRYPFLIIKERNGAHLFDTRLFLGYKENQRLIAEALATEA